MNAGRENRILKDTALVFMGSTLRDLYSDDAVDNHSDFIYEQTVKKWRQISEQIGRKDLQYLLRLFNEDAHDFEIIRNDHRCLEVIVKKCIHADTFGRYNSRELGEKLICRNDFAVVEGYNPDIKLTRPCTAMTGCCCHFIFELTD